MVSINAAAFAEKSLWLLTNIIKRHIHNKNTLLISNQYWCLQIYYSDNNHINMKHLYGIILFTSYTNFIIPALAGETRDI